MSKNVKLNRKKAEKIKIRLKNAKSFLEFEEALIRGFCDILRVPEKLVFGKDYRRR